MDFCHSRSLPAQPPPAARASSTPLRLALPGLARLTHEQIRAAGDAGLSLEAWFPELVWLPN